MDFSHKTLSTFQPVFVARQPIFDREDSVFGYELLFRSCREDLVASFSDGDAATSSVITEGYSMARSALGADKKIFINFTERLLLEEAPFALPPENCMIEILETVTPDSRVIESCTRLKHEGYTLVLDDYKGQEAFKPLFPYLDIVKVDISRLPPRKVLELTELLRVHEVKLLAEKIENLKVYNACKRCGFDLFQGFFFCRPQLLPGKKPSAARISRFRLLKELSRPDVEVAALAEIIQADAALSYRMLRFINSVFFGLRHKVNSIQHAITLVGLRQLTQWARLTILSDLSDAFYTHELVFLAAQRGKFLQDMSRSSPSMPLETSSMFMFGLFTMLPALLDQDMETILGQLPLDREVSEALMGRNPLARRWFRLTLALERGDWPEAEFFLDKLGLDKQTAAATHAKSMAWAESFIRPEVTE